jgi:hypothetical protein
MTAGAASAFIIAVLMGEVFAPILLARNRNIHEKLHSKIDAGFCQVMKSKTQSKSIIGIIKG